jgi:hypothetical protein
MRPTLTIYKGLRDVDFDSTGADFIPRQLRAFLLNKKPRSFVAFEWQLQRKRNQQAAHSLRFRRPYIASTLRAPIPDRIRPLGTGAARITSSSPNALPFDPPGRVGFPGTESNDGSVV